MSRKFVFPDPDDTVKSYLAGKSGKAIARDLGVSLGVVKRFLIAAGVTLRSAQTTRRPTHLWGREQEICDAYLAGESAKSLAERFECSRMAINTIIREKGICIRGIREADQLHVSKRTKEENHRYVQAAHAAVRGKTQTFEHRCKIAATRERQPSNVSPYELLLRKWLTDRGLVSTPQKAIGPYNADLASGTVAVEVFGGNWHGSGRHARRAPDRFRYILDQG